jgi:hypothetical protein
MQLNRVDKYISIYIYIFVLFQTHIECIGTRALSEPYEMVAHHTALRFNLPKVLACSSNDLCGPTSGVS